jgi:glutamine synthetase
MKYKFEYIWLDGNTPEPNLRSKTKIINMPDIQGVIFPLSPTVEDLPIWFFDGSSTGQAEGNYSDCALKPVHMIYDPNRTTENSEAYLVMCEVMMPDGVTPHPSNTRATIPEDDESFWFGFEQEYVLINPGTGLPLGFPQAGYPEPQGPYYCSVGYDNAVGREIVESHLDTCLFAGLNVTGINAEVMKGQWEFQMLGYGAKQAADELWLARYLMYRISERHEVLFDLHPKPVDGDWNGSGMHCNFSNDRMREEGGEYLEQICEAFQALHPEHIAEYGSKNELRLTGKHETASINEFKVGVSDRGASIRIPQTTAAAVKGYLEDRRPASNADPYRIVARIVKTINTIE